ncbi:hypothetical protein F2P56_034104 [Juglans regia]|uniref:Uncharacterized protein n=2 Tax=Juglans regia TaxID=51240 RepID=A0A833SNL5_JUGRE|nr:uncharacterized protein LOC108992342 [Juglans regia]KAF5445021.1 hypothetical protein F2P56_034104 [Juglans regia]
MTTSRFPVSMSLLLLHFLVYVQLPTLILAFIPSSNTSNSSHNYIQDVLKEISARQSWDLNDVRVSKLDLKKVRFGSAQRYEYRVAFGRNRLVLKYVDGVDSWKKLGTEKSDFGSLVGEVGSMGVLDTFKVEGPFELLVGGSDEVSLQLPMNTSIKGLNRVLVGEGITVEVRRAQEVSLFHSSNLGFLVNRSLVNNKVKNEFWAFQHSMCIPLLPIQVLGAASLVAYKTRNRDAYIETKFVSKGTIELLPEKCYRVFKERDCPIDSLSSGIAMVERVLRNFLGDRILQKHLRFLKTKIKASAIIRFQLELERHVRSNDTLHAKLAEWRTKPNIQRIWFEVMARVEAERLKPLSIEKVNPFIGVDTVSWSNLMANVSFTQLGSILVPPEALTLDVKW